MSIKIRTQRNYQTWPSWDLVYEWEDVLAKELKGSFVYESKYLDNKYVKRIPDIYRILVTKGSTTIAFLYKIIYGIPRMLFLVLLIFI